MTTSTETNTTMDAGLIVSIEDQKGQTIEYTYNTEGELKAWFNFGVFWVTLAAQIRPSLTMAQSTNESSLRSLEALEAQQLQPVRMRFASQQFLGAFPHPFRHLRTHETAVIEEKLQQA